MRMSKISLQESLKSNSDAEKIDTEEIVIYKDKRIDLKNQKISQNQKPGHSEVGGTIKIIDPFNEGESEKIVPLQIGSLSRSSSANPLTNRGEELVGIH